MTMTTVMMILPAVQAVPPTPPRVSPTIKHPVLMRRYDGYYIATVPSVHPSIAIMDEDLDGAFLSAEDVLEEFLGQS